MRGTGAICAQFIRCGKPACRCARGELHGPYYYRFTREWTATGKRQQKRYVRKAEAEAELDAQARRRALSAALAPFIAETRRKPDLFDMMMRKMDKWRFF